MCEIDQEKQGTFIGDTDKLKLLNILNTLQFVESEIEDAIEMVQTMIGETK